MKILADLKALGYSVTLEGENIRLKYLGIGEQPSESRPLIEVLKAQKAEAVQYLLAQRPLPYLDVYGELRIPFDSEPRFHYWAGGQSIKQTEEEFKWLH